MTLQDLLNRLPANVIAKADQVELHIFEDGRCYEAQFVIAEEVIGTVYIVDLQKGERA